MGPTPSRDGARELLDVARASIEHGLGFERPLEVDPEHYPPPLREPRGAFGPLRRDGELRGCTGVLEPLYPLVETVARCAFRTAFRDPRFPPVEADELDLLEIHLSVLSPIEPFPVASEAELCERLRPGVDGLVLREGSLVGTFLPAVWKSLPSASAFVTELKCKAGLPRDYWSPTLTIERYTVEEIP